MPPKSLQLQIRVTPRQKAALRREARAAGLGMSEYVLARVLPSADNRFAALVRDLTTADDPRAVLAEMNDFLTACAPTEFNAALAEADLSGLSSYLANYVAAMVEQTAHRNRITAPVWARDVAPLAGPHFATNLASLRAHLLRATPVPFKRRNIFVDSSVGARA
jgi:hypothetical protein